MSYLVNQRFNELLFFKKYCFTNVGQSFVLHHKHLVQRSPLAISAHGPSSHLGEIVSNSIARRHISNKTRQIKSFIKASRNIYISFTIVGLPMKCFKCFFLISIVKKNLNILFLEALFLITINTSETYVYNGQKLILIDILPILHHRYFFMLPQHSVLRDVNDFIEINNLDLCHSRLILRNRRN